MVINPKEIVDRGLIENTEGGEFEVQQNGIDITLGDVQLITGGSLGKEVRTINDYIKVDPEENGYYTFDPSFCYSIDFQQKIKVPEDMCAQIVQRSTLNRMGAFILSGVYDSGFQNIIGAVLRTNAQVRIEKGARVAQVVFMKAESASLYNGKYQGK